MKKVVTVWFEFTVFVDVRKEQPVNNTASVGQTRTSVDPPPSQEEEEDPGP
jgi:hypothetical protein